MAVQREKLTLAEYSDFANAPERENLIYELIHGELVEKMPSFTPSRIAVRISRRLDTYVDEHDLGYVTGADGGYIMSGEDVFIPDVGYISKARLPQTPVREVPVPPDMAVEVKSPTDSKREMRKKAERYLDFGTQLVWLVFPDERLVEVYVPEEDVITVDIDGVLDGGDVLPGFTLPVREIFG